MVFQAKRWRFTPSMIADSPAHPGVYALWENDTLLRLGYARGRETIRSKLLALLQASGIAPTHYSWEIASRPVERAREIVRQLEAG